MGTELEVNFNKPMQFYEYLNRYGLVDSIYKAMENPDLSEIAMTVKGIFLLTRNMPNSIKVIKSEEKSTACRHLGNTAFGKKKYQEALVCYNLALLYAPKNSRALKLAYSNRSALLHTLKLFTYCLKDIEMCFSLGCPPDIVDKVKTRQESAKQFIWLENLGRLSSSHSYSQTFFNFEANNPEIPCASTNVGVVVKNHIPKIVATKDIKAGEVLAIETAFVSITARENMKFSCYYCQKIDLNLMPCHTCCLALFCSEKCRTNCLKEYHSTECQIIDTLELIAPGHLSVPRLAVKAILKILNLCSNNWKELIKESQVMGMKRIESSSIKNIVDVDYKFSLLNTKDEKHFLYGPMYNYSFSCAAIIHFLDLIPKIFPQKSDEKESAQRAFARMYMFLNLYCIPTEFVPGITLHQQGMMEYHELSNFGWFPFIGKLSYSCNPNSFTVNLHRKLALISTRPIKRGEALTIMMVDSYHQKDINTRYNNMMSMYGSVCVCEICTGEYKKLAFTPLSDAQKKTMKKIKFDDMKKTLNPQTAPGYYEKMCKALALLNNVQFSVEYSEVYNLFRRCMLYFEDAQCRNEMLDYA